MPPEMAGALAGAGIVWQTPANPPEAQDYIFRNGNRCGAASPRPTPSEFLTLNPPGTNH